MTHATAVVHLYLRLLAERCTAVTADLLLTADSILSFVKTHISPLRFLLRIAATADRLLLWFAVWTDRMYRKYVPIYTTYEQQWQ
jgi:hypothetical protein